VLSCSLSEMSGSAEWQRRSSTISGKFAWTAFFFLLEREFWSQTLNKGVLPSTSVWLMSTLSPSCGFHDNKNFTAATFPYLQATCRGVRR
jgi:hypothetical protein